MTPHDQRRIDRAKATCACESCEEMRLHGDRSPRLPEPLFAEVDKLRLDLVDLNQKIEVAVVRGDEGMLRSILAGPLALAAREAMQRTDTRGIE